MNGQEGGGGGGEWCRSLTLFIAFMMLSTLIQPIQAGKLIRVKYSSSE